MHTCNECNESLTAQLALTRRVSEGCPGQFGMTDVIAAGIMVASQPFGNLVTSQRKGKAMKLDFISVLGLAAMTTFACAQESTKKTLRESMRIAEKTLPEDSPQLAATKATLGRVLSAQKRPREAEPLLRDSYPILVKAQGENAVITQRTRAAIDELASVASAR